MSDKITPLERIFGKEEAEYLLRAVAFHEQQRNFRSSRPAPEWNTDWGTNPNEYNDSNEPVPQRALKESLPQTPTLESIAQEKNPPKKSHKLFKILAYSTLGSLTHDIQKKIEARLGPELYNSSHSAGANAASNFFIYTSAAAALAYNYTSDFRFSASVASYACGYALIESLGRLLMSINHVDQDAASLPGKLLSLPIQQSFKLRDYLQKQNNTSFSDYHPPGRIERTLSSISSTWKRFARKYLWEFG